MLGPRQNRATWDDTYMRMAQVLADRSPDPNTQVGSILVDKNYRIVSGGYNGTPRGIDPILVPWDREGEPGAVKYDWVLHAEHNAIENATASTKDCILYVTLEPCHKCAATIIQAEIKEVVYSDDRYHDTWSVQLALKMFAMANIKVRKHVWANNEQQ